MLGFVSRGQENKSLGDHSTQSLQNVDPVKNGGKSEFRPICFSSLGQRSPPLYTESAKAGHCL